MTGKAVLDAVLSQLKAPENRAWLLSAGVVLLTTAAAVTFRASSMHRGRSRRSNSSSTKMKRRVSYTSRGLALGSFPEHTNVPDAIINTAAYFDGRPPSVQDVVRLIVEPLLREQYPRLSQVLDRATGVFHEPSQPYQAQDLVREILVQGDDSCTHDMIFDHLVDDLKHTDRPWWEILIIKNTGPGMSACVVRVHHALADGLALVHAFQKVLTTKTNVGSTKVPPDTHAPKPMGHSAENDAGAASVATGAETTQNMNRITTKKKKNALSVVFSFIEATFHVLGLGATKFDDDTMFSKANHAAMVHTGNRKFALFPTVPLDFIKQLKSASNVTVNDILMTAISQAIHDYCRQHDDPVFRSQKGATSIQCRALLPVGFPRTSSELQNPDTALRNVWCMVSCDLAVGEADILERLWKIKANSAELKETPRAVVQLHLQNFVAPLLPTKLARQSVMDVFARHSLVVTNVPGMDQQCLFAGKVVKEIQLFFNNLVTQVDLLSYAGNVYGNIVFDPDTLPDLQHTFGRYYGRALLQLAERLQVAPPVALVAALDEDDE
jgi:diacylglycerol O-acyltransferase / wax synthase